MVLIALLVGIAIGAALMSRRRPSAQPVSVMGQLVDEDRASLLARIEAAEDELQRVAPVIEEALRENQRLLTQLSARANRYRDDDRNVLRLKKR